MNIGSSQIGSLLSQHEKVEDIRYIVLRLKKEHKVINKDVVMSYVLSKTNIIEYNFNINSKHTTLPNNNPLLKCALFISKTLIYSEPNTKNGISIVVDKPMNNKEQLNIKRPAVLRQYYGTEVGDDQLSIARRPAFGYLNKRQLEGTDRFNLIVKPFSEEMKTMAMYITNLLIENKNLLCLDGIDLSQCFNSCTILLYHRIPGTKESSSMGFHTDVKYTNQGKYSEKRNSISKDTVTVIYTIGDSRVLNWRQKIIKDGKNVYVNDNWSLSMTLNEGELLILNPKDECPHVNKEMNGSIKYEHGKVRIAKDRCSIAFVFRVCNKFENFNKVDNRMLVESKDGNDNSSLALTNELYKSVDVEQYHTKLIDAFISIIERV